MALQLGLGSLLFGALLGLRLALANDLVDGCEPSSLTLKSCVEVDHAEISRHPLGSSENPVRVWMPEGERAYLERLRCDSGKHPVYNRAGSTGVGPYGFVMDVYTLSCGDRDYFIYMDMYHETHVETGAPAGFHSE